MDEEKETYIQKLVTTEAKGSNRGKIENKEAKIDAIGLIRHMLSSALWGRVWRDTGCERTQGLFSGCTQPSGERSQATQNSSITE